MYLDVKVAQVVFMRNGADTRDSEGRIRDEADPCRFVLRLCHQTLSLLHYPLRENRHGANG